MHRKENHIHNLFTLTGVQTVLGQNGSGQNGIRIKWHGQNGMNKTVLIKSSTYQSRSH